MPPKFFFSFHARRFFNNVLLSHKAGFITLFIAVLHFCTAAAAVHPVNPFPMANAKRFDFTDIKSTAHHKHALEVCGRKSRAAARPPFASPAAQHGGCVALIDAYADWCGHCKRLAKELEATAGMLQARNMSDHATIVKFDAERVKEIANVYGVNGGYPAIFIVRTPTPSKSSLSKDDGTRAFPEGASVWRYEGPRSAPDLANAMARTLAMPWTPSDEAATPPFPQLRASAVHIRGDFDAENFMKLAALGAPFRAFLVRGLKVRNRDTNDVNKVVEQVEHVLQTMTGPSAAPVAWIGIVDKEVPAPQTDTAVDDLLVPSERDLASQPHMVAVVPPENGSLLRLERDGDMLLLRGKSVEAVASYVEMHRLPPMPQLAQAIFPAMAKSPRMMALLAVRDPDDAATKLWRSNILDTMIKSYRQHFQFGIVDARMLDPWLQETYGFTSKTRQLPAFVVHKQGGAERRGPLGGRAYIFSHPYPADATGDVLASVNSFLGDLRDGVDVPGGFDAGGEGGVLASIANLFESRWTMAILMIFLPLPLFLMTFSGIVGPPDSTKTNKKPAPSTEAAADETSPKTRNKPGSSKATAATAEKKKTK